MIVGTTSLLIASIGKLPQNLSKQETPQKVKRKKEKSRRSGTHAIK